MLRGTKKLAYLSGDQNVEFESHGFVVEPFQCCGSQRWLAYRPYDSWRANAWRRTYDMYYSGRICKRYADARCGVLLGYTKKQIRWFLGRKDGMS